jgi:hypothetical protein
MQPGTRTGEESKRSGPDASRELVWFADAFEKARRNRVGTGERIAVIASVTEPAKDPEDVLAAIGEGSTDGPMPLLGRTYRRQLAIERQMVRALSTRLHAHPTWTWLARVRGVDPLSSARLLGRLDPARASTPSAFWAYCGFATVPGVEYRCGTCGFTVACAVGDEAPRMHRRPGGRKQCSGTLAPHQGAEKVVRVAQPKAVGDGHTAYDRVAKQIVFQIGSALVEAGDAYARVYREERYWLDLQRRDWPSPRRHMTALRKMEKQFLSHLWLVWREALGLPLTQPHPVSDPRRRTFLDPWAMVDPDAPATLDTWNPRAMADRSVAPSRAVEGAA